MASPLSRQLLCALAPIVVWLGTLPSAQAAIVFGTGNRDAGSLSNVIFTGCGALPTQPNAKKVQGCLDGAAGTVIDFGSDEQLKVDSNNNKVVAVDRDLNGLSVFLDSPGATFNEIVLALKTDGKSGDSRKITFTAFLSGGGSFTSADPFSISGNANQFFYVRADDGQRLTGISFASDGGNGRVSLDYVKNVQMGGVTLDPSVRVSGPLTVPEPGTLALLGLGLAGIAVTRRRKQSTACRSTR